MDPIDAPGLVGRIFSPQFLQSVGLIVVVLGIIFGKDFLSKWKWEKNGVDRRTYTTSSGIDTNKLLDIMQGHLEATQNFAHETKLLTQTIANLAENIDRDVEKSNTQHKQILREIDALDVPRK